MMNDQRQIPVTILTGFLGAGKTTLLNRILRERHGRKIAVIENEFGEVGIDNEILLQDRDEQIVEMNNGCICCTVRSDLVRILGTLSEKRKAGKLDFERVVIETTGLADPVPVAQTFFVDAPIARDYLLDAIITVVDAKHAPDQLDRFHEAQEQIGFADRILLSKTDLVTEADTQSLKRRLRQMNPQAPMKSVNFGQVDLTDVLDIRSFDLDAILTLEPDFLTGYAHTHDDAIGSFVYRSVRPFDTFKLERFLGGMVEICGMSLLRYKGVLSIADDPNRIIFQGVHKMMGATRGEPWKVDEVRESVMVFIGRDLPRAQFEEGLRLCVAVDGVEQKR